MRLGIRVSVSNKFQIIFKLQKLDKSYVTLDHEIFLIQFSRVIEMKCCGMDVAIIVILVKQKRYIKLSDKIELQAVLLDFDSLCAMVAEQI